MIRLFTAIPIPTDIRHTLHAMGQSIPGAKAVAEDQIHITLRFIGEVEGSIYKDIQETLHTVEASPSAWAYKASDTFHHGVNHGFSGPVSSQRTSSFD